MLVEGPDLALPARLDHDMKALFDLARTVLEHPPAVEGAIEILRQGKRRLLAAVSVDAGRGAGPETQAGDERDGFFHRKSSRMARQRHNSVSASSLHNRGSPA